MACPTEEYIESISGLKLGQIKKLDLENMGFPTLSADVFKKMPCLASLNLARNKIRDIPADLRLLKLKELDVSDNMLTSLDFVAQFPLLEDLETDGNDLEPSDKYIAASLCPRLASLNGSCTNILKKMVLSFRERLQPQVNGVWEANFAHKHIGGIKDEDMEPVKEEFFWVLKKQKLTGPTILNKLRDYMVRVLAEELLQRVKSGGYQSPTKRRRLENAPGTPSTPKFVAIKRKGLVANLPSIHDFEPAHFIRCHCGGSKEHGDNDSTDDLTQVWRAEFEPHPTKPGEQTGIVATAGGSCICLIDCNTGRLMKRYKEIGRRFFTLAWTTLEIKFGTACSPTNILVATGVDAIVKLFHPDQLVCYHEFEVGTKRGPAYINTTRFHPTRKSHLFCGDSDGNITAWDIGVPTGSKYETTVTQLFTLRSHVDAVLNITITDNDRLLAGCEGGCFMWNIGPKLRGNVKNPHSEIVFPGKHEGDVDGMCIISGDLVASKVAESASVYLWRMNEVLDSKKKLIKVDPMAVLEWKSTDVMYLNLGASQQGLLACGDDMGNLWLYNVAHLLKKSAQSDELLRPSRILPWPEFDIQGEREVESQMTDLLKEKKEMIINHAIVSQKNDFVVACSASNMVGIWKRQQ